LNVRPSTVQNGVACFGKTPWGAAAKLLQLVEKKGIEVLAV
jgi:DNA-binding transcriptional regulator YiaG